jgi:DNA polymerase-4
LPQPMATSSHKWILHLDMDAFFASVEQRDRPEYQGRPVVVGAMPGRRGVVSTCSYEARRFGIRSAMPISEAYRRCPEAVYLRPDMSRYADVSRQVMELLNDISPVVEPVSIDEAYVDITGLERLMGTPEEIGLFTKQKIREAAGLTCSVGIGPNRLIAKLASEHRKPDGLMVVRPEEVQAFLDPMPVSNLRGVGAKTRQGLERLGIHSVVRLRACSLELLQSHFGNKGGSHLYHQARGIASDRVGAEAGRQSISKETTFDVDTTDQQVLRETLRKLAAEVGQSARRKGLKGRVVTLKIRLQDFETHVRQRKIAEATHADGRILDTAWELYCDSGFAGRAVRLIGVGISDWGEDARQEDLFETGKDRKREEELYATLDRVNEKFGDGVLLRGMKK